MSQKVKKVAKKKQRRKSTALVLPSINALDPNAMTRDRVQLIKNTVAIGSSDDELKLFLHICQRTGLDPFARQIYLIQRDSKDGKRGVVQTGIDGFRSVAERTKQLAGRDAPEFGPMIEGPVDKPSKYNPKPLSFKYPEWAKVRVHKSIDGKIVSTEAIGYFEEFYPGDKLGFMWRKMPRVMLPKCVEAQALRAAFPAVLGGVYVIEELDQAGPMMAKAAKIVEQGEVAPPPIVSKENAIALFIAKINSTTSIDTLMSMRDDYKDNPKVASEVKSKLDTLIDARIDALMPK